MVKLWVAVLATVAALAVGFLVGGMIGGETPNARDRGAAVGDPTDDSARGQVDSASSGAPDVDVSSDDDERDPAPAAPEGDDAAGVEAAEAASRAEALRGELADARAEAARLRDQLAALARERDALAERSSEPASTAVFTFGAFGNSDAVRSADWPALAEAAVGVRDSLYEIFELQRQGLPVPRPLAIRQQQAAERMRVFEFAAIEQGFETAAVNNGENTHPATLANYVAAALVNAELPLSDAQTERIAADGQAYETSIAATRERYTSDTLRVRRILDEYRAKGQFRDALWSTLRSQQRDALASPDHANVFYRDMFSPTLMLITPMPVMIGPDRDTVRATLKQQLTDAFTLDPAAEIHIDAALQRWETDVQTLFAPVLQADIYFWHYDQGLTAAEATVRLYDSIRVAVQLTEQASAAIRDATRIYLPRIVPPDPAQEG